MNKHRTLIQATLEEILLYTNERIDFSMEEEYGPPKRVLGELDLRVYYFRTQTLRVHEMKTNLTEKAEKKALNQLKRVRDIYIQHWFDLPVKIYLPYITTMEGKNPHEPIHYEVKL